MRRLEIRRATALELQEVVEVWERSRWEAQPWLEERMGYSREQNLAHFTSVVAARNDVWVAVKDSRIVGLLAARNGNVDQLYVEPRVQRQGIGRALSSRAKELWPSGLSLFTHQRNEKARAFYEKEGFIAVAFGMSPAPENEPDVKYEWFPTR